MPAFDLRGIRLGKYNSAAGNVTYDEVTSAGDAMNVNLELRFAEGRLYAESKLAEYIKEATGGTISIGVKYIPDDAKSLLYGAAKNTRQISINNEQVSVSGIKYTTKDAPNYVGVSFYAPDMIDGVHKYTCVFISKALFGQPAMNYQTKGENITFQTPTTTGEFLGDDSTAQNLIESAIVDNEETAIAWTKAVLGDTSTE